MDILGWLLIVALFIIGMLGTVFPILPGVFAVYAAFFVYGWFFSFEPFGFWFWTIQTLIVVIIFVADYAVSAMGVKKFGGSKASVIGSTIGLIIGPFVIPAFGLILGPFIGAVIGELIIGMSMKQAIKSGVGSVIGFFSSVVVKVILQLVMIIVFIIWI
ncbi:DUF456 domain-containing protein [Paenibacillus sp. KN14-4R]|uniref:DUF456 domain-containing protein n=1 Tax=Paenibacillus sp. KN14-4R TaxID=3445773 RepID=UPI003FA1946E